MFPLPALTHPPVPPWSPQNKAELQLKQLNSKASLLEKNIEKKDAQAGKRRESMMANVKATKDQVGAMEDRLRAAQVEVQRSQVSGAGATEPGGGSVGGCREWSGVALAVIGIHALMKGCMSG